MLVKIENYCNGTFECIPLFLHILQVALVIFTVVLWVVIIKIQINKGLRVFKCDLVGWIHRPKLIEKL